MNTSRLHPADLTTWLKGLAGCTFIGFIFWLLASGYSYWIWYLLFAILALRLGAAILRL